MKSALLTLLLIMATATQPMLAAPAACSMNGERRAMTCAGCCAVNPCCAPSEREQSSPLAAVAKSAADFLPAVISPPVGVPAPIVRQIVFPKFARALGDAHAPPPLTLNCIQLI